jgi:hypothetical protein
MLARDEQLPSGHRDCEARLIGIMRTVTRAHLLWFFIAAVAAMTRFPGLDGLLSDAEASVALASLSAARGEPAVLLNPLFGFVQTGLFALFGPSNVAARGFAALAGVTLALTPYVLRARIGEVRALSFGALLALSPTLVFVSRQAEGASLAWLLAVLTLTLLAVRPTLAAVTFGLLLANGVDAPIPAAAVVMVIALGGGQGFRGLFDRRVGLALGAAFALGVTGLFLRTQGLSDVFAGYSAWAQTLSAPGPLSLSRMMAGFFASEGLVLTTALIAVVLLVLRQAQAAGLSAMFAWVTAGLVAALTGSTASALVPLVISLSALGALTLARLSTRPSVDAPGWTLLTFAMIGFVLCQFVGLGIRQFAAEGQPSALLAMLITLIMLAAIIAAAAINGYPGVGLRGTGWALIASLALTALATGFAFSLPRTATTVEAYAASAPSAELAALARTVDTVGLRATGEREAVAIQIAPSAPPALRWALRFQDRARYTESLGERRAALLPENVKPPADQPLVGNAFEVTRDTTLNSVRCGTGDGIVACQPVARWLTFREASAGDINAQRWVLWLTADLARQASGQR